MILTEQTTIPSNALPVAAMKTHLRLGTGFADDGMQDGLIETYLRAAMATIEGRIGKALLSRDFLWVLEDWRCAEGQVLPRAPVSSIVSLTLFDAAGAATLVAATVYRLQRDTHRPRVQPAGSLLPSAQTGGRIEVRFTAGFGTAWASLPADLAQAVFLLAARYYEARHQAGESEGLPAGVAALLEGWRDLRLSGGGAA